MITFYVRAILIIIVSTVSLVTKGMSQIPNQGVVLKVDNDKLIFDDTGEAGTKIDTRKEWAITIKGLDENAKKAILQIDNTEIERRPYDAEKPGLAEWWVPPNKGARVRVKLLLDGTIAKILEADSPIGTGKEENDDKSTDLNEDDAISVEEAKLRFRSDPVSAAHFDNSYDDKENHAYIFMDPLGRLINDIPVNIDADDKITVMVLVPKNNAKNYIVDKVEGRYAPADLTLRETGSVPKINSASDEAEYAVLAFPFQPVTSPTVKFDLILLENNKRKILRSVIIPVNSLYHAGFGISFVHSEMNNVRYVIASIPNVNDKTIVGIDNGGRTMVTLNVILYWRIFNPDWYLGGVLLKGRDVLKEAPFWDRIFPTIGVALSENVSKNIFIGLAFEFTRGSNIVGGVHLGKIRRLAVPGFKIGIDTFSGTNDEIVTSEESWTAPFIGVNLDSRIVTALVGMRQ